LIPQDPRDRNKQYQVGGSSCQSITKDNQCVVLGRRAIGAGGSNRSFETKDPIEQVYFHTFRGLFSAMTPSKPTPNPTTQEKSIEID
jgi:hypothetical protein